MLKSLDYSSDHLLSTVDRHFLSTVLDIKDTDTKSLVSTFLVSLLVEKKQTCMQCDKCSKKGVYNMCYRGTKTGHLTPPEEFREAFPERAKFELILEV